MRRRCVSAGRSGHGLLLAESVGCAATRPSRPLLRSTVPSARGRRALRHGYRFAAPPAGLSALADRADDVARHRAQLRAPRAPAVVAAGREVEVAVVPADVAVLLVEEPGCCPSPRRPDRSSRRRSPPMFDRAPDPDPGVVLRQQHACTHGSCHFHRPSCGAPHMPLPSTPPNCCRPGQDRAVGGGVRRVQEARQRTGEAEAVGVEGGQRHRARTRPERRRRRRGHRVPGPCWRPASRAARWTGTCPTACCRPAPSWCTC